MRKKKSVTLQELSRQSGLSVHTVSKALRGLPGMSEETRNHVHKVAQEIGYRTKDQERVHAVERIPLHPRKPFRFKMVISDKAQTSDMILLILSGVQEKLAEYGHSIETVTIPYHLESDTLQNWSKLHQLEYCDGVFITPMVGKKQEEHLLRHPIPRILINFPGPAATVDSVVWDVGTAIHQSVRHLLAKGHTQIMYVGNISIHRGFILRWQSFVTAMTAAGIHVDPKHHMTEGLGGQENWMAQLNGKLLQFQPSAILVALSQDLVWVYNACSQIGKQIPQDMSLISLENAENAFVPELSRPLLLIKEAGNRAAARMLWRMANPHLPYEHILLQGHFYDGSTVQARKSRIL
ncbi:LacI family DNA-binding transcriptional regulator [Paenibacillus allorhizosphaerae]|uniref:Catabolite control protein A n=1 Tax=Paenibacillus allorhizosphaerae TaxID=2849866 RepID=A0ABN7TFV1_9BACL|nr:LacI family DNA-binding transcriptional regulator [Paenibacillus allorhizosphaerae]CAG7616787.1 Catabolite control protein A [Paenibacillus allorhizosphaerae]